MNAVTHLPHQRRTDVDRINAAVQALRSGDVAGVSDDVLAEALADLLARLAAAAAVTRQAEPAAVRLADAVVARAGRPGWSS